MGYVLVMHPGNRLRDMRKAAKLTQGEVAERSGIEQNRISNYENGKRPLTLALMKTLARAIGCSVADILVDEDNPERLSAHERDLVEAFRSSDERAQDILLTSARAVAEQKVSYRSRSAA